MRLTSRHGDVLVTLKFEAEECGKKLKLMVDKVLKSFKTFGYR